MRLETTYLNERIEMFEGVFDQARDRQMQAVSRLYNRHLGPLTATHLERPDLWDPSMYCASCNHLPMSAVIPDLTIRPAAGDSMSIPGGGKGAGITQPLLGAMGELAERFLAVMHFQAIVDELEFGSWEQLTTRGLRALSPDEWPLFAAEQYALRGFAFEPFRSDTPLRWLRAERLFSAEEIWVPAQLVLLYYKRAAGEAMIGYPTSGGLAFHTDRQRAVEHALYEYIERDAVNVRWYSRLAPPRVDIDLSGYIGRVATPSVDEIRLYLNTLDVPIPVFTVVAFDESRTERRFLGGGGAWHDRDRALEQTLFELGQTRAVLNSYKPGAKHIRANTPTSEMTDFLDGAVYFGYPENLGRFNWYMTGDDIEWTQVPTNGNLDAIRESGINPIVVDTGGAGWPGVHVLRVIVPELTNACVAAHPYLGHPRYYEMPQRLGLLDHKLTFEELNPDPVPFP